MFQSKGNITNEIRQVIHYPDDYQINSRVQPRVSVAIDPKQLANGFHQHNRTISSVYPLQMESNVLGHHSIAKPQTGLLLTQQNKQSRNKCSFLNSTKMDSTGSIVPKDPKVS
jgi:hypothetical protein